MSDITDADIRGETERGRQAYNQRRRYLRDEGIAVLPDLYGDDELLTQAEREINEIYNNRQAPSSVDYSRAQYWDDLAAKDREDAAVEREWDAQDERIRKQFGVRNP